MDKLATSFTVSSVTEAVNDFEEALGLFRSKDNFATHKCAEIVRYLDHVQHQASKSPYAEDVAVGFASFFNRIKDLENHGIVSAAETRIHRQVIMLGNWSLFKWLDMLLTDIWTTASLEPAGWLRKLGQKV